MLMSLVRVVREDEKQGGKKEKDLDWSSVRLMSVE
jgi:hypothetical protein